MFPNTGGKLNCLPIVLTLQHTVYDPYVWRRTSSKEHYDIEEEDDRERHGLVLSAEKTIRVASSRISWRRLVYHIKKHYSHIILIRRLIEWSVHTKTRLFYTYDILCQVFTVCPRVCVRDIC